MENQEPPDSGGSSMPTPQASPDPNVARAPVTQPTVVPRSPALHLIVSVFLPGVGSMMNGQVGKGVAILLGYIVCWVLFWLLIPIFVAAGLWIYGMVDAYQGAQRWNRAHGIVS